MVGVKEPLPMSGMTDPADLTALEARERLASGSLRAAELTDACLGRIAAREPDVQAWACIDEELALNQAGMLDDYRQTGRPLGALHGLPVGIKDIIDTRDLPTENGNALDAGRRPTDDAWLVARLRAAGAVIPGKTVTTECAYLAPGKTRNPHNPERTPGGSSSGSAAAVASGMVPFAVGTQTGGSVIRPASFCGVVGFKPTFGLIPRSGVLRTSRRLDTVGTFARTVEDAALLADVLAGHDAADPDSVPMRAATAAGDRLERTPGYATAGVRQDAGLGRTSMRTVPRDLRNWSMRSATAATRSSFQGSSPRGRRRTAASCWPRWRTTCAATMIGDQSGWPLRRAAQSKRAARSPRKPISQRWTGVRPSTPDWERYLGAMTQSSHRRRRARHRSDWEAPAAPHSMCCGHSWVFRR